MGGKKSNKATTTKGQGGSTPNRSEQNKSDNRETVSQTPTTGGRRSQEGENPTENDNRTGDNGENNQQHTPATVSTIGGLPPAGPGSNQFKAIAKSIHRMAQFVETEEFERLNFVQVNVRYTRLMELHEKLNELFMQLLDTTNEEISEHFQTEWEATEDITCTLRAVFEERLEQIKPTTKESPATPSEPAEGQNIKVNVTLPERPHDIKNTWGKFDGDLLKWQTFHDLFTARVHSNASIPPAYKFTYLKNSLEGKASSLLGEWHLTDGSYMEAWERLKSLYNHKYPICRAYLRKFQRMPCMQGKATYKELMELSNDTHEVIRQLRAQQLPVDEWDMFIVHNLHERLDEETAQKWEWHRINTLKSETPKAIDILDFLDKQATSLSNATEQKSDHLQVMIDNERSGRRNTFRPASTSRSSSAARSSYNKGATGGAGGGGSRKPPCEVCAGNHGMYGCPDFQALNLNGRWEFVKRRKLCANCLKPGHLAENCNDVKCGNPNCFRNPAHNSVLCPEKVGRSTVLSVSNSTTLKRNSD